MSRSARHIPSSLSIHPTPRRTELLGLVSVLLTLVLFFFVTPEAIASGLPGDDGQGDSLVNVLIALAFILVGAKLCAALVQRANQPAVLGELLFGVLLGNAALLGIGWFESLSELDTLRIFAEIGVILLLFEVGLESDLGQMVKVGASSLLVATLGVIGPFFLGWAVGIWFYPDAPIYVHMFLGAIMTATSVGITARVLKDLKRIDTTEARIILGAAVIDDILGLLILAVVSGIIQAVNAGQEMSSLSVIWLIIRTLLFLAGAIVVGRLLYKPMFRIAGYLRVHGMLLITALASCFAMAYVAAQVGLAPIVGAFAAGLVLDQAHYEDLDNLGNQRVETLLHPLGLFLIPVFFVNMGMDVDLSTFANASVLGFALVLTVAAILGKQLSSLGVVNATQLRVNRWIVGLGMIPRGEVGLIFAGLGLGLSINGEPVVSAEIYAAVVIMVILTTLVTPPTLAWAFRRKR